MRERVKLPFLVQMEKYDDKLFFLGKVLSISLCFTKTWINHIKITPQKYQQNMFSHVPPFFPMIFPRFFPHLSAARVTPASFAEQLVMELRGHVKDAASSPHANYVLQKATAKKGRFDIPLYIYILVSSYPMGTIWDQYLIPKGYEPILMG